MCAEVFMHTGLPQNPAPALVTTVHDRDGRLLRFLARSVEVLSRYGAIYASITNQTDPRIAEALHCLDANVDVGPTGAPGEGQRRALAAAFRGGHSDLFVCDFDRWLHWHCAYPDELADLPRRIASDHASAWYICLGRTERALATHPTAQVLPETLTNRALSAVAGTRLDATAGGAWIRPEAARLILTGSIATSKATDLEWPGLVLAIDRSRVQGAFLEGLEFETADAYSEEIAALGSREAWIRDTYDRPQVLHDRAQLAADSITALLRVTGER
jgi:hypothetical protein